MAVEINGDGLITVDGTSTTQGRVRLKEDTDNGSNYVELTAPASVTANRTITFPDDTGTVLTNSGNQTGVFSALTVNSNNISADNSLGFRNRIINGDMRIDQRNAGASVTLTSGGNFSVDRFQGFEDTDGAMTAQQDSSAPAGFINSVKITTTTADGSLSASQYALFRQMVEGTNVADLAWGTASAKTVTLSFWVRSSLTGTFGGALGNSAFNRSYPFTYSISVADTWEYKTVTIAGDTSGTWLTTTGTGIRVNFGLGVGTDYSGTAGAWAGAGYLSATGATSVIGTLNATWYITGVQLEVGSTATPFERRPYGTELALCQRYYQSINSVWFYGSGNGSATTASIITETSCPLFVPLRASPTLGSVDISQMDADSYSSKSGVTPTANGFNVNRQLVLNWTGLNADLQDNRPCAVRNNTVLTISAEL